MFLPAMILDMLLGYTTEATYVFAATPAVEDLQPLYRFSHFIGVMQFLDL
jgi:hypothetical protein